MRWPLNVASVVRRRKTTKPREWPTAKWDRGTNKRGTSAGSKLWTSSEFREDARARKRGRTSSTAEDSEGRNERVGTARQERVDALANLLLAQWRLEHGEAFN